MFHSQSACFYCPREGCEGGEEGSRYIRLHVAGATESATIRYVAEKEEGEERRRRRRNRSVDFIFAGMTLCAVTVAPRCWKMWHLEHWQVHRWVPDDQQSLTHVLPPLHTHTHTHPPRQGGGEPGVVTCSANGAGCDATLLSAEIPGHHCDSQRWGGREGGKRILGKKDSVIKYNFT